MVHQASGNSRLSAGVSGGSRCRRLRFKLNNDYIYRNYRHAKGLASLCKYQTNVQMRSPSDAPLALPPPSLSSGSTQAHTCATVDGQNRAASSPVRTPNDSDDSESDTNTIGIETPDEERSEESGGEESDKSNDNSKLDCDGSDQAVDAGLAI
jgi:hypothetical protein